MSHHLNCLMFSGRALNWERIEWIGMWASTVLTLNVAGFALLPRRANHHQPSRLLQLSHHSHVWWHKELISGIFCLIKRLHFSSIPREKRQLQPPYQWYHLPVQIFCPRSVHITEQISIFIAIERKVFSFVALINNGNKQQNPITIKRSARH